MSDQADVKKFLSETQLKDIMKKDVYAIRIDQPFRLVPQMLGEFNIRHLPVVDHKKRVVGMITQREMYKIQSPRKLIDGQWFYDEDALSDIILEHVMIKDPCTLLPEHPLGKALVKMAYSRVGGIPIVDYHGVLLGIVTRRDLLRLIADFYSK